MTSKGLHKIGKVFCEYCGSRAPFPDGGCGSNLSKRYGSSLRLPTLSNAALLLQVHFLVVNCHCQHSILANP